MTVNDVIAQFNRIFIDVLEEEDIILKYETVADDIEDWDSLTHIQIIVAIEKHYSISFTANEIATFKNVGEMCDGVLVKLSV